MKALLWCTLILGLLAVPRGACFAASFEVDRFVTPAGEVTVTFLGHGTLLFSFGGTVIHVDPYGKVADYGALPKADGVLITHEHGDHLDTSALALIMTPETDLVLNAASAEVLGKGRVMKNGERGTVAGIAVEAVPAYNVVHKRENGQPFHPKGAHNGYILTYGGMRFYIAGDTENTQEMSALQDIDVAFLPMNLPYTMTPEMVADGALAFRPKILYPYHYGDTDTKELVARLADSGIDVRIRAMK